jgi:hypothetical protein
VQRCRQQDSALPVSALRWLASFNDERQVNDLVELLLGNGAVLESREGEGDDLTLGRVHGTIHWAIWRRNIPAVRALTKAARREASRSSYMDCSDNALL